jgi:hypothetical protein
LTVPRLALLLLAWSVTACSTLRVPVVPPLAGPVILGRPTSGLFVNVRAPLVFEFDETRVATKHGESHVTFVQDPLLTGLNVAWGDASVELAAEEAGISTVHYADYEFLSVLGIFVRFTTHVYGE